MFGLGSSGDPYLFQQKRIYLMSSRFQSPAHVRARYPGCLYIHGRVMIERDFVSLTTPQLYRNIALW